MPPPTVALFDIDGTLLTAAGAGRRAIDRSIESVFGVSGTMENAELAGRTDPWIVRAALAKAGLDDDDASVERVLDGYVRFLSEEIAKVEARAFAGVVELLDSLATQAGLALGLGTGNLQRSARVKLSAVGLEHYFSFGGFSSDDEDRGRLLGVGAQRGAQRLGLSIEQCTVIVIGDTPHDVSAAKAIGATCVAVATGRHSVEQLGHTDADVIVETLEDPQVAEVILRR